MHFTSCPIPLKIKCAALAEEKYWNTPKKKCDDHSSFTTCRSIRSIIPNTRSKDIKIPGVPLGRHGTFSGLGHPRSSRVRGMCVSCPFSEGFCFIQTTCFEPLVISHFWSATQNMGLYGINMVLIIPIADSTVRIFGSQLVDQHVRLLTLNSNSDCFPSTASLSCLYPVVARRAGCFFSDQHIQLQRQLKVVQRPPGDRSWKRAVSELRVALCVTTHGFG